MTMSDRVAVFSAGQLRQVAAPRRLYEEPDSLFVAQFLGESNILPGIVRQRHGGQCSVTLSVGQVVVATAVGTSEKVNLAIRPEKIALGAAAAGCVNRYPAKVIEVSFLGDQLRVRLETLGRDDFIVKFANAPDQAALEPGGAVEIGWRAEDCRALGE
jgi:putative spermidine/putrescine transport system ATP-binding protein